MLLMKALYVMAIINLTIGTSVLPTLDNFLDNFRIEIR